MENPATEHKTGVEVDVEQITADEIRSQLGELLGRAGFGRERFIITRHGKPIAALVGMRDFGMLPQAAA